MDVRKIREKLFEYIHDSALKLIAEEEDAEVPVKQFEVLREITPYFNNIFDRGYVKEYEEKEKRKAVGYYLLTVTKERLCAERKISSAEEYVRTVFNHDKVLSENFEYLYDIYDILPKEYLSDIVCE